MVTLAFSNLKLLVGALALLYLAAAPPRSKAVVTCAQVSSAISPCTGYLGGRESISSGCCPGIRGLQRLARSKEDRQAVCRCLESSVRGRFSSRIVRAQRLVAACGVRLNYPISLSVDCSKVT